MTKNIKLSPEFKAQTVRAIISIALFALTYLLILLLAVVLTALCVYGGIMLILASPGFITIALGIGLASLGILILIFLLKFVFKSHKVDSSHLHEIKKEDEPGIFHFIQEIVDEIGTSFPKKVYLSSDVNAAVFYDSNFWSMFLPIKKNLQVGLGLINTVTEAELKAILAHEFGHFSQKTMKVGSYVYNVNQVIFNMLYDNESYHKLIQNWANVSGYFSIFVGLAIKIIEGIQWILRKLYEVVNKSYRGLSREMEFHADEIAASVTGFEPLKSSLLRMTLADHAFNNVLNFYEGKIADNIRPENLYRDHNFLMNFLATANNIPIINNFPGVTTEEFSRFSRSKLIIKDQWSSHPSTKERIERLEKTNLTAKQIEYIPANDIFKNIEILQQKLTYKIFEEVSYQSQPTSISFEEFQIEYKKEVLNNTFPKSFNGYYDDKNPIPFETDCAYLIEENINAEELFSDQKVDLVYSVIALQNDIETLKQMADKTISIKTFDYDGKKYKRKENKELIPKLSLELEQANEQIKQNDIAIFQFFRKCEKAHNNTYQLENLYRKFFEFDKEFNAKYGTYTKLSGELQFLNFTTPFEQIQTNFRQIKSIEIELKKGIRELLEDGKFEEEITKEIKQNLELYLSKQWEYFGNEKYFDDNLKILFLAMNNYAFLLSRQYFLLKKKLLDYQDGLIKNHAQHEFTAIGGVSVN